jgi:predicted DNA binding CopG/RHH family protein
VSEDKRYEDMTEAELEAEFDAAIARRRKEGRGPQLLGDRALETDRTVPISLRVPSRLLARLKREAERRGTPYQRLLLALVEDGLGRTGDEATPTRVHIPAEALREGHVLIDVELLPPAASQ